jgi:hypothetical protein
MLTDKDLKDHCFVKSRRILVEEIPVWKRRIHDLLFLEFDPSDGFMALAQNLEKRGPGRPGSANSELVKRIYIPKPIRTVEDLELLLKAVTTERILKNEIQICST